MHQAKAFYYEETTDVEGFCDKLMEDIIKVIDTLNRIELRYKAVRIDQCLPPDRVESIKRTYDDEIRQLEKSYRQYQQLFSLPKNS